MKQIFAFPSLLLSTICALGLMTNFVNAQLSGSLTNGLVSYYPFDGNTDDVAGTNDATGIGVVPTNGVTGAANTAYYFNRSASYLTAPYIHCWNNAFTWSFWINPQQINPGDSYPLSSAKLGHAGISPSFWIGADSRFGFFSYDPAASHEQNLFANRIETSSALPTNTWTMLTVTSDTNNVRSFYVNGNLAATKTTTGYGAPVFDGLIFGVDFGLRDELSLLGALDDVAIYDRPLASNEVTDLYQIQSVPEPSTYALLLLGGAASLWALKRRNS